MKYHHEFANCRIDIDTTNQAGWHVPGLAVVMFHDGATTTARPHVTSEYLAHSRRAGYGECVGAFTLEHELAHAFIAECLGEQYSHVQWNDAHGVDWHTYQAELIDEERYVRHFQRFCNLGRCNYQKVQQLLDAGLDLDALAKEWRAMVKNIFGSADWWKLEL